MDVSYLFRQAVEGESLRSRRFRVIRFCVVALIVFAGTLCCGQTGWRRASRLLLPGFLATYPASLTRNRTSSIMVGSLDERSLLRYRLPFDQLSPEQQSEILSHYKVGNYLFPRPDWLQPPAPAVALKTRLIAAGIACVLWMAAYSLRSPAWKHTLLLSFPLPLLVAAVFIWRLPALIELWTEPDTPSPLSLG